MRHVEIADTGERGFVTDTGKFALREEAAKIAIAAGQVPDTVTRLHSEDLPEYKKRKKA
jgi:Mn-dependent DtxR family transcriptional regulator